MPAPRSHRRARLAALVSLVLAFQPAAYLNGIFLPYWPMFAVGL